MGPPPKQMHVFLLNANEGRERDDVPRIGKTAQDVIGFDFGTGVGRVGKDWGEEKNTHHNMFYANPSNGRRFLSTRIIVKDQLSPSLCQHACKVRVYSFLPLFSGIEGPVGPSVLDEI